MPHGVGVELDGGDVDSAGVFEHLLLLRQLSAASGSQNDVAARREPDRDLEADLTSSAEEQYRLDVIHVRTRSHRSSVLDYRRGMTLTPSTTPSSQQTLTEDGLKFVGEYHLATLTTLRPNGTPHVVAVGFTWDQEAGKARVITSGGSQKAINAARGGYAAVSSVDGGRWLTLEGAGTSAHRRGLRGRRRSALCRAVPPATGQSRARGNRNRRHTHTRVRCIQGKLIRRGQSGRADGLLNDSQPSAVTTTMSSIRAPQLPRK